MKAIHAVKPICENDECSETHNGTIENILGDMSGLFDQLDQYIETLATEAS